MEQLNDLNTVAALAAVLTPEASTTTDTSTPEIDVNSAAPEVEESTAEGPTVYGVIVNIPAGIAYLAEYASAEDLCDPGHHYSLCFWSENWEECWEYLEKNFPDMIEGEMDYD